MELTTHGTNNIVGLCSVAVTCRNTLNLLPATESNHRMYVHSRVCPPFFSYHHDIWVFVYTSS